MLPVTMFDESVLPQGAVNALNIVTLLIVAALLPFLMWRAYKHNRRYDKAEETVPEDNIEKKNEESSSGT